MSFFAPRKAGRNRLNRAGYLTASFVSSLDNTASIACVRFRARSPNLRPLLLSFSPLFPLYNAPFLSIILSARLGAHSADLAAQSCALNIPQRTPIGSLDNTAARLASPPPQTRSLKTSLPRTLFHSPHSCLAALYIYPYYNRGVARVRFISQTGSPPSVLSFPSTVPAFLPFDIPTCFYMCEINAARVSPSALGSIR